MTAPLNRSTADAPAPAPVRIVHLGLGAFHRAHQAWYTQHASDSAQWGIAAFTGRSPDAATALAAQDGLYTLVERGGDGDTFELMGSIVRALDGADVAALCRLVAAAATAMVTLTITEAGYCLAADATLDTASPAVQRDIAVLRSILAPAGVDSMSDAGRGPDAPWSDAGQEPFAVTAPGRLVQALAARRSAGSGPIAVVSCDNLSDNAAAARASIAGLAAAASPGLGAWIVDNVSFVGTSVDRITPRTTGADVALVESACGYADSSPVVAEPFMDWVLCGDFPAGRPDWASAGAVFVDDIKDFENRKLWLLNGAHSLMAYAGQLRGHQTVAQAVSDPLCAGWITEFWDEAERNLPATGLGIPAYRQALLARFGNARIAHHLEQIAMDGSSKLRMRAVPVLKAELTAGRSGAGAARMIAAWVAYLCDAQCRGAAIADSNGAGLDAALKLPEAERLQALLAVLDAELAADGAALAALAAQVESLVAQCGSLTGQRESLASPATRSQPADVVFPPSPANQSGANPSRAD